MFLDALSRFDCFMWVPVLFWVGLFFVARFGAFPLELKRRVRLGERWVYVSKRWGKGSPVASFWQLLSVLLGALAAVSTTLVCSRGVSLLGLDPLFGLASIVVFVPLAVCVFRLAASRVFELERSAHFLFYRRLVHKSQLEGKLPNEEDLRTRSAWEFHNALWKAERRGRFFRYLNAAARSKKIPKDLLWRPHED